MYSKVRSASPESMSSRTGWDPGTLVMSSVSKPAACTASTPILPRISCSVKFLDVTRTSVPSAPSTGRMEPGAASGT